MAMKKQQRKPAPSRQPAPPIDPGIEDDRAPLLKQELAISQESAIASRFELLQYNPDDLFTRKGVRTLEKMATTDDTIAMCLTSLKMMALSAGYRIDAASEDPLDERIADEVAENFENMVGSLREKLFSIMGALDLGVSFHEKVWDKWPEGSEFAGHIRLTTLKSKNPRWFNAAQDDFGNIIGFVMISAPAYGRKIPTRKMLVYSGQKRYENVWGTARARALYDWWYLKGLAKASLAVLLQKYGKDTPIGFVPPNMSPADKASFLNALANLARNAAATMPEGVKIDFMKSDINSVKGCLEVIEKADQQMTKVILGQVSSSGTSSQQSGGKGSGNQQGGSSKGGAQEQTLDMYLDYICGDLSENPFAELIKEIVDFNYDGVTRYPKFVFKARSEEDRSAAVKIFIEACNARIGGTPDVVLPSGETEPGEPGVGLVNPTPEDEEWIRSVLGAPTASSKNSLRPGRPNARAKERVLPELPPVDPRQLPLGGYRPPTPSAPGLPANYAEPAEMPKPRRELSKFERGVDFAETWKIMDAEGEKAIASAAAAVLKRAVDKLKVSAKKAIGDSSRIRKLEMPLRAELARVVAEGLKGVARRAMRQAGLELARKGRPVPVPKVAQKLAEAYDLGGMAPEDVLELIHNRSFTMAGKISDEALNDIKNRMYAGVKSGKSYKEIVYEMEDSLAKYVDLSAADGDLAGHRLMSAVRTGVSSAYSQARDAIFEDAELDGFVLAYQFSAVLDGDTTSWCGHMDGRIFKVTNPIWGRWTPPTYYQCRSLKIPITKVDDWDGEESPEPTDDPPEGFN